MSRTSRVTIRCVAALAAVVSSLTTAPAHADEPRIVTVTFRAFIPATVPAGVVLTGGPYAGMTAVRGPHPRGGSTCYVTDQRGFSSSPGASARVSGEIVVDVDKGSLRSRTAVSHPTHAVNCDDGSLLCTATATSRIAVTNFRSSGRNVSMRVDIAGNNPCVRGSPDIDMTFQLTLVKMGDNDVGVNVTGNVEPVPSFEAYARINDCPPKVLFQQSVDPRRFLQRGFFGLTGAPDVPVRGSTVLDPDQCDPCPAESPELLGGQPSAGPSAPVVVACEARSVEGVLQRGGGADRPDGDDTEPRSSGIGTIPPTLADAAELRLDSMPLGTGDVGVQATLFDAAPPLPELEPTIDGPSIPATVAPAGADATEVDGSIEPVDRTSPREHQARERPRR